MYYLFANSYLRPVLSSAVIPGNVALQKCPPGNIPNKHLYNTKANCLPTLVLNLKFSKELNNSCVFNIYFFFSISKSCRANYHIECINNVGPNVHSLFYCI